MNRHEADVVEHALTRLYRETTARVVAPEVAMIVDRARRRRRSQVVLAGVATLLAVIAGVALTGPRFEQSQLPISPTTPGPPSTPPEPQGQVRVDPATAIPSGFLENRPHLGTVNPDVVGGADDAIEWRSDGVLSDPQCVGEPVDQLTVRRGVGMSGPPARVSLYLYADEATARTVFASVETHGLPACIGYPQAQPSPEPWRSFGEESTAVTFPKPADGAGDLTGMSHHVIAVRVGSVIQVLESGPTFGYTAPVAAASREALESIVALSLPRLCLYTGAGCVPAAGQAEQLRELTRNGDAWLLLLHSMTPGRPDLKDGLAVAFAAEAGYHPTIVSWGCDLAEIGWEGGAPQGSYVALYFAQRDEAEAAAAALPAASALYLLPRIHHVRTRCVG